MFENLADKFERAFKVLKGQGQISEINVAETLKEVRRRAGVSRHHAQPHRPPFR